ncbi:MAG: hypothetical protein VB131_08010 [Burkholderia gladioli]
MTIKKSVVLDLTGAIAAYHVITNVAIDAASGITVATVSNYVSDDTYKAGKRPLQLAVNIAVSGVPKKDEGAFSYIQRRLIEAKPEDGASTADGSMIYNMADRYLLAGGEIVAD